MTGRTVFRGASVFDASSGTRPGTTVVVDGTRIAEVAPDSAVRANPDDVVVDVAGRTLMPGLIIAHYHIEYRALDVHKMHEMAIGTEWPPGVLMLIGLQNVHCLLDSGFTGCISAASAFAHDAQMKMAIDEGIVTGPRMMPASPHLNTTANEQDSVDWWMEPVDLGVEHFYDSPDEFRKAVRREVKRGAAIIKMYGSGGPAHYYAADRQLLTTAEIEAIVDTAHGLGAKVRSHCCWEEDAIRCIEAGVDVLDHGTEITEKVADLMAERGTYWAPTLHLLKVALDRMETPPESMLRQWKGLLHMIGYANSVGVKLLPGDDYGLDFMRHEPGIYGRELALYADAAGIPPIDVLRWATLHGAELMGLSGELGVIREGALADIVVVDGDPSADLGLLADPTNLAAVMANGGFHKNTLGVARDDELVGAVQRDGRS
jgi:imidazolonepropionase-like amidohydrolase